MEDGYVHDGGFAVAKREIEGILWIGIQIDATLTGSQKVIAKKAPDNVLSQISGRFFRSTVPKPDAPAAINDVNPGIQIVEDGLVDFRIV